MNSKGNILVITFVSLLSISLIISGYVYLQNQQFQKPKLETVNTDSSEASWKSYTNEKYNLSLKYDPKYSLDETYEPEASLPTYHLWFDNQTDKFNINIAALSNKEDAVIFSNLGNANLQKTIKYPSGEWKKYVSENGWEGSDPYSIYRLETQDFRYDLTCSNNEDSGINCEKILSTFQFLGSVPKNTELEALANKLDGLLKKGSFSQVANLITKIEVTCDSKRPYNPQVCNAVNDGVIKSGFSIGRYQSEGTTLSAEEYIKSLSSNFMTNKNLVYFGQITATPSGLVWLDKNNNNFVAFFVENKSGQWLLTSTIFGQATANIVNLEKFW